MTILDTIAKRLSDSSTADFVLFEEGSWSPAKLDREADRVANGILERAPEGAIVAVCMDRSPELVAVLLGCLRAGAAYLPLDPEDPPARRDYMLDDAAPAVVLAQSHLLSTLPAGIPILDVGELPGNGAPIHARPAGDDAAYVIYTSGSTGKPKGVINTHAALANRLDWMQGSYPLGADDTVLQKTPYTFDVSVWEFFWPLVTGARIAVAKPGGHRDPGYLADLVESSGATVMHFVPSMLQTFVEEPDLARRASSLRHVFASGEALTADLRDRVFEALPTVQLHNLYGPTEAAIDVTQWTCSRDDRSRTVPIGHAVENTAIYIVDEEGRRVSPGREGELCIGGVQVAKGYLNRPDLTEERFVPDPFTEEPGGRMYRTGDLAVERPDGAFEFFGRMDSQVKLRGFRIELGEIEASLADDPAVQQAVVVLRTVGSDPELVAYVTVLEDPDTEEVRRRLAERLPHYMVPGRFVVLEAFPLTSSGKVDRNALPPPPAERPDLSHPFVAPRTPLERYLATLWREIIGVEPVGIHDRFMELGGNSLQAARFVARLRAELDAFLYVVTLFDAPTIAEFASLLESDYAQQIGERFDTNAGAEPDASLGPVTEDDLVRFAATVPQRSTPRSVTARRNPPAGFILAPPRSGTTLLRVMLAGHPALFAAAELQLLGFETLRERRDAFSGRFSAWLEGTVRTVMELTDRDAESAWAFMADAEERGLTTQEFYGLVQEHLGGRLLIDKSPQYALDPGALAHADADFEDARFVHLVRHPHAMATSFARYHMDQILYVKERPFHGRTLGELVWTLSHRTIAAFLEQIPAQRHVTVRFEDLVRDPRSTMEEICDTLGVPFHEGVITPYSDLDDKMTDGVHAESTPMGDTHFLERRRIDPSVADVEEAVIADDFLGEPTWELAATLGYERPQAWTGHTETDRISALSARRARTARRRRGR